MGFPPLAPSQRQTRLRATLLREAKPRSAKSFRTKAALLLSPERSLAPRSHSAGRASARGSGRGRTGETPFPPYTCDVFDTLSDRLQSALGDLRGRGRLDEETVARATREIRLALLEADVNFRVV